MPSLTKENSWTGGKSPHKFTFTYQDIADLSGLSLNTIRKYASKGKFNPNSLESILRFLWTKIK